MSREPRALVSTWVYCESSGATGEYPQVTGDPATFEYQSVYWRCAAVSLMSARAAFTDAELFLYTNVASLPVVGGVDMSNLFASLGVTVRHVQLSRVLSGDSRLWRNQLYVFDVLEDLVSRAGSTDAVIVTDGDCVWTKSPCDFLDDVAEHGAVTYQIEYDESIPVNGISLVDAARVRSELQPGGFSVSPSYYGGELIAVTGRVAREICTLSERLLERNLERERTGRSFLTEEAHILSALYDYLGVGNAVGNRYIKRMWTALRFHNVVAADDRLLLWHLPAEKEYAFDLMFRQAQHLKLFGRASQDPDEVLAAIRHVLSCSWQLGLTRLRFDARRVFTACRKRWESAWTSPLT